LSAIVQEAVEVLVIFLYYYYYFFNALGRIDPEGKKVS